jgi:hypothetical protein
VTIWQLALHFCARNLHVLKLHMEHFGFSAFPASLPEISPAIFPHLLFLPKLALHDSCISRIRTYNGMIKGLKDALWCACFPGV